jgi:hypothetical protein
MTILVECDADETVLRALGVPKKRLLHLGGRNRVISRLRHLPGAIGVIDEDPGTTQHLDMTSSYHPCETREGLRLLRRQGKGGQKLIMVCPKLEDWLLARAKQARMKPETYGLPGDPDRLHSIPRYEKRDGFSRFLAELMRHDEGVAVLRRWLEQPDTLA